MERTPLKVGVVEGFTTPCSSVKASQPLHFLVSSPQAHLHRNEFFSLHFTDFFFSPLHSNPAPCFSFHCKDPPSRLVEPWAGPLPRGPAPQLHGNISRSSEICQSFSLPPSPTPSHTHMLRPLQATPRKEEFQSTSSLGTPKKSVGK